MTLRQIFLSLLPLLLLSRPGRRVIICEELPVHVPSLLRAAFVVRSSLALLLTLHLLSAFFLALRLPPLALLFQLLLLRRNCLSLAFLPLAPLSAILLLLLLVFVRIEGRYLKPRLERLDLLLAFILHRLPLIIQLRARCRFLRIQARMPLLILRPLLVSSTAPNTILVA